MFFLLVFEGYILIEKIFLCCFLVMKLTRLCMGIEGSFSNFDFSAFKADLCYPMYIGIHYKYVVLHGNGHKLPSHKKTNAKNCTLFSFLSDKYFIVIRNQYKNPSWGVESRQIWLHYKVSNIFQGRSSEPSLLCESQVKIFCVL